MNEGNWWGIIGVILALGLMTIGITAMVNNHDSVVRSIEAGYSPTTLPGVEGVFWVKNCE